MRAEARPRARTPSGKLKFTLPGPMTIVDTIADAPLRRPGRRWRWRSPTCSTRKRARCEADGVDVIQFDEPAFNVFMDEVAGWGIEALHRAIDGLTCTTAVHICYGYGIKANIDWKNDARRANGGSTRRFFRRWPKAESTRCRSSAATRTCR